VALLKSNRELYRHPFCGNSSPAPCLRRTCIAHVHISGIGKE
jgi:hypothetical protein